ncbi:uncharacterized protein [Miscanthus floridulus]|uniref:uncharacterized protein n=1 Tax=Miscanthus floridulus TaxID=154761 RepID=UPI0034576A57
MVDPIVGTKWLTKILMDGGSGLNIMHAKTLDEMGIDQTRVHPTRAPFHGIVPRKQAMALRKIDLPITFGDPSNYRMKTLTFEVVGFPATFHAILGRPCYTKFMAVPNYTYLKLKIPGPSGVITVDTSFQHAYECEVECCGHAAAIVASGELAAIKKVTKEAPDTKKSTGSSKIPAAPMARWCAWAPRFPLNKKMRSSTSSMPTRTSLCGNPWTCQAS